MKQLIVILIADLFLAIFCLFMATGCGRDALTVEKAARNCYTQGTQYICPDITPK